MEPATLHMLLSDTVRTRVHSASTLLACNIIHVIALVLPCCKHMALLVNAAHCPARVVDD